MTGREGRYRTEGWAWGITFEKREWLTIAGSARQSAALAVDPGDAVPPPPIVGQPHILARVARHGTYFRILEIAPEHQQHTLVTAHDDRHGHVVTGWCSCSTWTWDGQRSVFESGWQFTGSDRPDVVAAAYVREHAPAA